MNLTLETQVNTLDATVKFKFPNGNFALGAPIVDEDYWSLRVQVGNGQAIVGFPKFGTIGIGFQKKTDWNSNLPYTCDAEKIYNHIKHNSKGVDKETCLIAIRMIQKAAPEFVQPI